MAIDQSQARRKASGSRYKANRKGRQFELGRLPSLTKIESIARKRTIRTMGANSKLRLLSTNIANLYNPKSKSYSKATITTTSGNPANRHFVRRNILTRGSIIETDKGKARITSRPGQDGIVNAVLIS